MIGTEYYDDRPHQRNQCEEKDANATDEVRGCARASAERVFTSLGILFNIHLLDRVSGPNGGDSPASPHFCIGHWIGQELTKSTRAL